MLEVRQTESYVKWFRALRDTKAAKRIVVCVRRLAEGNPGQHRVLQGGVGEMKIDYGPCYRVYYTRRNEVLVILLCGGDKRTQAADILRATALGVCPSNSSTTLTTDCFGIKADGKDLSRVGH